MIYLAFYKGKKSWVDRVICWATRSLYSHCEITRSDLTGKQGYSISSSGRDGGVRENQINFNPDHWDFLPVHWAPESTVQTAQNELGKKYDFLGLILSQMLNLRRGENRKWFCSELCAHALGMARPSRFSPGDLYLEINERNELIEAN